MTPAVADIGASTSTSTSTETPGTAAAAQRCTACPDGAALLDAHERKDLLRFLTCGSVDDGKSTLVGRLLCDSRRVYEDQLEEAVRASVKHGTTGGDLDYALLLDGLLAEREQGITIDVAYRYFATDRRAFIVADCPGHVQYTRNMATGASTCDLAVLLVDARAGVVEQTRRHALICSLLGIRHLVLAVNKMDLVAWSAERFFAVRDAFIGFATRLGVPDIHCVPVCALSGANIAQPAADAPWWSGGTLLHHLETVHVASDRNLVDLRLPVQLALRPHEGFRGYAGTVASGVVRPGEAVMVMPSGRRTTVREVRGPDGPVAQAFPPMAVTVTLADDVDCGRGDWIVHPGNRPTIATAFEAMVVWMDEAPLLPGRRLLLKQCTRTVHAAADVIRYQMDVRDLRRQSVEALPLNGIGRVSWRAAQPLFVDAYDRNRATGCFVIIDPATARTVGAGMLLDRKADAGSSADVTSAERAGRLGHAPLAVVLPPDAEAEAVTLERLLFDRGLFAAVIRPFDAAPVERARALLAAGLVVLIPAKLSAEHLADLPCLSPDLGQRGAADLERVAAAVAARTARGGD